MIEKKILFFTLLALLTLWSCKKDPYEDFVPEPSSTPSSPAPTRAPSTSLPTSRPTSSKKIPKTTSQPTSKTKEEPTLPLLKKTIPSLKDPTKILFGKKKKSLLLDEKDSLALDGTQWNQGSEETGKGLSFGGLSLSMNTDLSGMLDDDGEKEDQKTKSTTQPATQPTSQPIPTKTTSKKTTPSPRKTAAPSFPKDGILAKVNESPIYLKDFLRSMEIRKKLLLAQNLPLPTGEALRKLRKKALDMMIAEKLLYQRALQRGLSVNDDEFQLARQHFLKTLPPSMSEEEFLQKMKLSKKQLEEKLRRQLILQKFMKILMMEISISPLELRQFYDKTVGSGEVHVRHIVLLFGESPSAEKKAKLHQKILKILELVRKEGADFAAIAKKYSEDGSSENGGDLGYIKRGESLKALEKEIFDMQKGEIRGPIESSIGYHIVKVIDRKKPTPFQLVQSRLQYQLRMLKLKDYIQKITRQLRREADIEIFVPWAK